MGWTPDPQLDQNILRIVTRAHEEALRDEREKTEAANADFARRNILNSGFAVAAAEDIAAESFGAWVTRALADVLSHFRSIYGDVPVDAVPWIRAKFLEIVDHFPEAAARTFAEKRSRAGIRGAEGIREKFARVASGLKRNLEIELGPIEMRARLGSIARGELPSRTDGGRDIDAFISHASEDKADIARPLADALTEQGWRVWLDEYELKIGMSVYAAIDDGLRRTRFGVVILSANFFAKNWPQNELHALAALGAAEGRNKLLPVWHQVGHAEVAQFSPLLADVFAARMSEGFEKVVSQIGGALRRQ